MRLETSNLILKIQEIVCCKTTTTKLTCDTVLTEVQIFLEISQNFMLLSIICFHTLFKIPHCIWLHWATFSSVQSLSRVPLFATPWIAARQASLSITNSPSSPRLTSIESVMPSSHLILWRPLLLLPPIPPSIRAFSNESNLRMRWPKYWSFSFSIIPSKEIPGLISFRMDWLDLLGVQGTLKSLLHTTVQKHQFLGVQPSSQSNFHIHTWPQEKPWPWLDGPLLAK